MDTSETYRKMCQKAEEIQKSWIHHVGDWLVATKRYTGTSNGGVINVGDLCIAMNEFHDGGIELGVQARTTKAGYSYMRKRDCVWLPREDQLQEMIGDYEECFELLSGFYYYDVGCEGDSLLDIPYEPLTSMEQLWLAFVMKKKYGKVWNGKDWVK